MTRDRLHEQIDLPRRRFLGTVTEIAAAAASLGILGAQSNAAAETTTRRLTAITPGTNTAFTPPKQIDAGLLNVSYAELGPSNGPPVILLHGWPYDVHSFGDVAPLLASAGYRAIVPYLRGYGGTRFLSSPSYS